MPYKVVQTLENGKPVLTAVPQSWEKQGTLYWPKNQVDKLIKVEDFCPEESWIPIACELKRDNLNYEEAQNEINSMLYRGVSGNDQSNRNESVAEPSTSTHSNSTLKSESMQDPLVYDEQTPAPLPTELELVLENQRIMLENQKKIMRKITELQTKLNKITSSSQIPPSYSSFSEHDTVFTPIDNVEALDELENDLKDPEKRNGFYKKYSVICNGRGEGGTCAYFLTDLLFTRKFLTKVSWSGGSRGEEAKVAFKAYTNIINSFQALIYECDKNFTLIECHNFFKLVLKNSVKRSAAKLMRASVRRKRSKHLSQIQITYNNTNNDDVEEYDENREDMELSPNASLLSSKKQRTTTDVDTSEEETDVEKELDESNGTLREVKNLK